MAYGKGPIKTGKLIPGKPGKRKPVKPVRPEPKVLMEKNEGRMYAGGDPNFNERTGEYRNKKKNSILDNFGAKSILDNFRAKDVQRKSNKVKKSTVSKPKPSIIRNPAKRKPVQPKVGR
jgi:hypothetical protein